MKAARDALGKGKGKPDETDAPPLGTFGTFPGASVKPIPGQLRLGE